MVLLFYLEIYHMEVSMNSLQERNWKTMRRHGLSTDEDLEQFSDVRQDAVRRSEAIFDTLNRG